MKKIVIIPTYNECENVEAMLDKVMSIEEPFDVLIIDENQNVRAIWAMGKLVSNTLFK